MRTWVSAAALLLLGPGLCLAQQGRFNPAVVGNPSYTGYGTPPPTFIPGAFGNPSYSGYNRPSYGIGFNPPYTGYDVRPYVGSRPYYETTPYTTPSSAYNVYRYNGQGRDFYSPLTTQSSYYAPQGVVAPAPGPFETFPENRDLQAVTLKVHVPTPAAEVFVE